MAERSSGRSLGRRIVVAVASGIGILVLVLVALILLLQTGPASRRVKDTVVPRLSAALGREVTVADAKLRLLPSPRVVLEGTTIAGRPGEPPLVKLASLDVEVGLWPLVRSLGKQVRVDGFTLVRPEINLVRAKDGTWNYEGLGGAPGKEKPAPKPAPEAPGGGPSVFVASARIVDGAVRFVDRSAGKDDAAVALTRIDLDASGGIGAAVKAKLSAALAAEAKNLELDLSTPRLPEKVAPGSYPELTGRFALKGLLLNRLRGFLPADATALFTGGRVDVEANVSSEPRAAAYLLDGTGKLGELRMKGQPASGGFELHARADPAAGTARVQVTNLAVKGPGVDLGGGATLTTKPVRATFAIKGPLLDVGTVLGLVPKDPNAPPAPKPEETGGALLPPAMAKEVAAVAVDGTIDIEKVVNGKLTVNDFHAKGALKEGIFALQEATAGLYGGTVDAGGTRVDLADPNPRWNLKAKLQGVDLANAFQAIAGQAPLAGKATAALDLSGVGSNWDQLKNVISGLAAVSLQDGALTTADLGGQALGALSQGLAAVGRGGAAKRVSALEEGKTTLRDLAASFKVDDGFLTLTKPLGFNTPAGAVTLGGKIGLSTELALDGTIAIPQQVVAQAGLPPIGAVNLPLKLGGTLSGPQVQLDASQAVKGVASGLVAGKKKELEGEAEKRKQQVEQEGRKRAEDAVRGLFR
jgi:AsmA protein